MQAILYARWSSLEQGRGTTAARQHEANEAFCARQGWPVIERVSDEGASAWTGSNISPTGNLGKLIARFERERADNVVLVVEKLDRLSRRPVMEMAAWVQRAIATGLTIATADGRHMLDSGRMVRDPMSAMSALFESFRGFDESQAKSDRVADAWAQKRKAGAPMTAKCPAWLRPVGSTSIRSDQTDSAYDVIDGRGATIRWMFEQTRAGVGAATLASRLNKRGEAAWGRGDGWHASYVKKILANPAVLGEYQPHTAPKGKERKPIGEPIPDYFPAVISVELFAAVNDGRAKRVLREQSGHDRLNNLFAGLSRCGDCGATMVLLNKGAEKLIDGTMADRRYLKCSRVHRSLGPCRNRNSYNYLAIESAILDRLLALAMDDQHFSAPDAVSGIEAELAGLKRQHDDAARRKNASMMLVQDDPDDELAIAQYRKHREAEKVAKDAMNDARERLTVARGAVSPAQHIARVSEVRSMMNDADDATRYEARRRVKLALNDLIEVVKFKIENVIVIMIEGARVIKIDTRGNILWDFDLIHPGRELFNPDPALAAYVRPLKASG